MPDSDKSLSLAAGDKLSRYIVLAKLGEGAMGVVLAAYDPDLDRRIALKFLLPTLGKELSSVGKSRLLREAQAMAKLSHPNVVTIFDVGEFEGKVFIAIELIEGGTMGQWLAESPRSRREIISAYVQAGQGLCAAHRLGLIHRDFKPDHILVDNAGVVRVADFGLAGHLGERGAKPDSTAETGGEQSPGQLDNSPSTPDSMELTAAGEMLGTPAYAAPEQLTGKEIDERADEFSFCVSLFEGLYGYRPFAGNTVFDLIVATQGGKIAAVPEDTEVPAWVHRLLVRGLSCDPEDRYASFAELLDDLGGQPQERLEAIWNPQVRSQIKNAFSQTGASFASDASATVLAELQDYAELWIKLYDDAWDATHIHHEQSVDIFDLKMLYLFERRQQFAALVDLFSEADTDTVQRAVQAVGELEALESELDLVALRSMVRPPVNAADRKTATRLKKELARCSALRGAGRYADALVIAREVITEAESLEHYPTIAAAHLAEGELLSLREEPKQARAAVLQAVYAADKGNDDRSRAKAFIDLVNIVGYRAGDAEAGRMWGEMADAVLIRSGGDPVLHARLLNNLGHIAFHCENYDEALELNQRALAIREDHLGPQHPAVADSLNNIGAIFAKQNDADSAIDFYTRALGIFEQACGSAHPDVAAALDNLASVYLHQSLPEKALAHYQRVVEILENGLAARHPRLARAYGRLGAAYLAMKQPQQALAPLRKSLDIDGDHAEHSAHAAPTALARFNLAQTMWRLGDDKPEALRLARQAKDEFFAAGERYRPQVEKLEAWITWALARR